MADGRLARRAAGSLLLAALPAAVVTAALSPGVREPVGRLARVIAADVLPDAARDLRLPVDVTEGVSPGDPAFLALADGAARPIASVVGVEAGALRLRFAPGEDSAGPWRVAVFPRAWTAREAIRLAVPPETSALLGSDLRDRAVRAWQEALAPAVKARLPAFLARLDPERDAPTREVLDRVGEAVIARLEPLGSDLAEHVTRALDERFDFLERMGLLWKALRGDGQGLRRALLPTAEVAARGWWAEHRALVLAEIGRGVASEAPRLEAWLEGQVLLAAEEEILRPVLAAEAPRLEAEVRGWLEGAAAHVALAPDGGFRRRFATLLRHHLLDKDDALVLLERVP